MIRQQQSNWKDKPGFRKNVDRTKKKIEGLEESRQKKVNWTSPVVLNRRPENGRPECYYCRRVGHIARFCFDNPPSSQNKGGQRNTIQRPQQIK
jgi:hypothetical protein